MAKSSPHERRIEKALGLTRAQILCLIKGGGKSGRITGAPAMALERRGLATGTLQGYLEDRHLTDAGREALAKVRTMGY